MTPKHGMSERMHGFSRTCICLFPLSVYFGKNCPFLYSSKLLQYMLHLHPTILPNYYKNYTNTTGKGPQGAKDNDYPVAINIKTCKY